jgi:hypothetical protein
MRWSFTFLRIVGSHPTGFLLFILQLGKDSDRDAALEPLVARGIDLAHPSGADRRDDLVKPET